MLWVFNFQIILGNQVDNPTKRLTSLSLPFLFILYTLFDLTIQTRVGTFVRVSYIVPLITNFPTEQGDVFYWSVMSLFRLLEEICSQRRCKQA